MKVAPEHTENKVLSMMMKPGIESFESFKKLFDKFSKKAGKKQYLIPYFIAAHPGSTDEDMLNLALWLKANDFQTRSGAGLPADTDGDCHIDVSLKQKPFTKSRQKKRTGIFSEEKETA